MDYPRLPKIVGLPVLFAVNPTIIQLSVFNIFEHYAVDSRTQ